MDKEREKLEEQRSERQESEMKVYKETKRQ